MAHEVGARTFDDLTRLFVESAHVARRRAHGKGLRTLGRSEWNSPASEVPSP